MAISPHELSMTDASSGLRRKNTRVRSASRLRNDSLESRFTIRARGVREALVVGGCGPITTRSHGVVAEVRLRLSLANSLSFGRR